jgi:hypothetical protein
VERILLKKILHTGMTCQKEINRWLLLRVSHTCVDVVFCIPYDDALFSWKILLKISLAFYDPKVHQYELASSGVLRFQCSLQE